MKAIRYDRFNCINPDGCYVRHEEYEALAKHALEMQDAAVRELDRVLALQGERIALQIENERLLDRIGVLERRTEAKEILSSHRDGSNG